MIFIVVAIVGAVVILLDAARNLRQGFAKTTFGTYSRQDQPTPFRVICGVKVLLSLILLALASVLIVRSQA